MSVNRSVLRAAMITTLVTAVVLLSWQGTPRSLAGILTDASAALHSARLDRP